MRGLMTGLMFCGLRAWCVGLRAVRGDARCARPPTRHAERAERGDACAG